MEATSAPRSVPGCVSSSSFALKQRDSPCNSPHPLYVRSRLVLHSKFVGAPLRPGGPTVLSRFRCKGLRRCQPLHCSDPGGIEIAPSKPQENSRLPALLGAFFTVGQAPVLAAEQNPTSVGEPIHTALWLAVAALLAAIGLALRAQWKTILAQLKKASSGLLRGHPALYNSLHWRSIDIGSMQYSVTPSFSPSLIGQLKEQDPRKATQISECIEMHVDPEEWESCRHDLGEPIGRYTITDEHGRSASSLVFETEEGDLLLEGGDRICSAKSIRMRQRQLIENATPRLQEGQREQLIDEVWRPGMSNREVLDRTLEAYDKYLHGRGILPSAGHAVKDLFAEANERLHDFASPQQPPLTEAKKKRKDKPAEEKDEEPLDRAETSGSSDEEKLYGGDVDSAFEKWRMEWGAESKSRAKERKSRLGLRKKERASLLAEWESLGGNGGGGGSGKGKAKAVGDVIDVGKVEKKVEQDWGEVWRERVKAYRKDLEEEVKAPEEIDVSFDGLQYPLDESTRWALVSSAYVHLKKSAYCNYVRGLPNLSPRLLLSGPPGSELYQEAVAKALARECGARFLKIDTAELWLVQEKFGLHDHMRFFSSAPSEGGKEGGFAGLSGSMDMPVVIQMRARDGEHEMVKQALQSLFELGSSKSSKAQTPGEFARMMALATGGSGGMDLGSEKAPRPKAPVQVMVGDKVMYTGPTDKEAATWARAGATGLKPETLGRVHSITPAGIGVQFDEDAADGYMSVFASKAKKDGDLHLCTAEELTVLDPTEDFTRMTLQALFEVVHSEAEKGPFVLYLRGLPDWLVEGSPDAKVDKFKSLLKKLHKLDPRVVVIASYVPQVEKREKTERRGLPQMDPMLEALMSQASSEKPEKEKPIPKFLTDLFPGHVALRVPQDSMLLADWKRQMEADKRALVVAANVHQINRVLASTQLRSFAANELDYSQRTLTEEQAQKVVAWAAAHLLTSDTKPEVSGHKLVIPQASLEYALSMLDVVDKKEEELTEEALDIELDNEYEKSLMAEVIPPSEVGVKFDDIGALESVKDTLQELVMLPLQRPELFRKGQLTKPAKGVLLFGPPGTGKTMLAKAVATEAGANFINVSLSSISSKWFGEAEKLVKAIFTLASKISPTVIFIDEVDSLLGARGSGGEHEATRKMKNEFMSCWDGLKTKSAERVLVLAATNRPFDLDDAVIRRMPRRLMVDLPDEENRAKILGVILREEELDGDVDLNALAAQTEGYSGSDLKNLCVAAAYEPIREILAQERKRKEAEKARRERAEAAAASTGEEDASQETAALVIRPMKMADFIKAKETVGASVSPDAGSINDLKKWNEEFGEGGNRRKRTLGFVLDPSAQ